MSPTSLINNTTVVIPFSVAHHFDKTYESGDTLSWWWRPLLPAMRPVTPATPRCKKKIWPSIVCYLSPKFIFRNSSGVQTLTLDFL